MLLIKPKDTRFHKRRLKFILSFLQLFIVDQFMRLIEWSIIGMKDCSWSINYSAGAAEIMIYHAEDVRNSPIVFPMMSPFAKALGTTSKLDCLLKMQLLVHTPLNQGCLPHTLNESFSQLVPDQDDLLILKLFFFPMTGSTENTNISYLMTWGTCHFYTLLYLLNVWVEYK